MNVLIFTAMYKRHSVSRLFAMGIRRFMAAAPENINCHVCAVITEGESARICVENGFSYVYAENNPLGKKWNRGMEFCLKELSYKWDYVLIMGDDDLISNTAWDHYLPHMQAGADYFGLNDIYFYKPAAKEAVHFSYTGRVSRNKLIGCGRMIKRSAVEKAGYYSQVQFNIDFNHGSHKFNKGECVDMPHFKAEYLVNMKKCVWYGPASRHNYFQLWKDVQEIGLDNESEIKLLLSGILSIPINTDIPLLTDVKTEQNLWKFETFKNDGVCVPVDERSPLWFMGIEEREYIEHVLCKSKQPV